MPISARSEPDPASRPPKELTETLSQFVARVLNQLSLSAWLPSAALVLALLVVFQLASALDQHTKEARSSDNGPGAAITEVMSAIADTSFGGAVLLLSAVVVLTVITQAFAFESIRFLEGYWGTWGLVEAVAERRTRRHERSGRRLRERLKLEMRRSVDLAVRAIKKDQTRARRLGLQSESLEWTAEHLSYLRAKVGQRKRIPDLEDSDRAVAEEIPWEAFAPYESLRRQRNLEKRLRDFPVPGRCLPTKLGTVLRSYEDATGYEPVETFVLHLYDKLPPALRTQHDDHRNRLDLYCSMVFVCGVVTVFGVLRLAGDHTSWALGLATVGVLTAALIYRAAIASARLYGIILVTIAERFPPVSLPVTEPNSAAEATASASG